MDAETTIALTGVRIVWSAEGADDAIGALRGAGWRAGAPPVKTTDRGVVVRGAMGSREVIAKTHRLRGVREIVAASVGRSRLARQARGAAMLAGAGVDTAPILVVARGTDGKGRRTELLVMERVPGVSVAHHAVWRDLADGECRALAHRLGEQVARISGAGLVNRDHKASNIIVRRTDADGPMPVVIDTVGVKRSHPASARVRMLFGLIIELVGLGAVPARTDRMRVVRAAMGESREARHRAWRAVEALVRMHGDATPRDNPVEHRPEGE